MASLNQDTTLRKELTAFDATSIVVGTVLGSAIFLIPATIASETGSPITVFLIWVTGGVLTLFGALSLAELGSMYPGAGGLYVYLREAYGALPAFLYGWGLLTVIHSASIAALAVGFGVYFAHLFVLGVVAEKAAAVTCIALLTVVNCLGVRLSKVVQNVFCVVKLCGIVVMVLMLFAHGAKLGLFRASFHAPDSNLTVMAVGAALVAVLWAYEGWHVVSFAAGEMRRPKTDLPSSLAIGTTIVVVVYLLANASYYSVLTPEEIRSNPAVAAVAMGKSFGPSASLFISLLILVSVVGAMNGMVLTGPRVYYAMAKDRVFFPSFARTSARHNVPTFSLCAQGLWAASLSCLGSYQQLFTSVIFAAWIFYGLAVAGVIVLRKAKPDLHRPYRVPGFPWVPLLFCGTTAAIVVSTVAGAPSRSLVGIGLILTGIPVFMFFQRRSRITWKQNVRTETQIP